MSESQFRVELHDQSGSISLEQVPGSRISYTIVEITGCDAFLRAVTHHVDRNPYANIDIPGFVVSGDQAWQFFEEMCRDPFSIGSRILRDAIWRVCSAQFVVTISQSDANGAPLKADATRTLQITYLPTGVMIYEEQVESALALRARETVGA